MQLLFLGTAAAEGYPALFCRCDHCNAARRLGGRDRRLRTSALVDGELLIDVGPDLVSAAHAYSLDLGRVRWVLQTHRHSDHLLESNFTWRMPGFAGTEPEWCELCGSGKTIEAVAGFGDPEQRHLTLRSVEPGETFRLGPYTVTALLARHDMTIGPLFYAIQRDDRALLWGNDTGPFFPETWAVLDRLAGEGLRFGVSVIEATMGTSPIPADTPGGHMNLEQCAAHHQELERRGLLAPGARRFAHHFSHNATPLHHDVEVLLGPHGVAPAYDGLTVTW